MDEKEIFGIATAAGRTPSRTKAEPTNTQIQLSEFMKRLFQIQDDLYILLSPHSLFLDFMIDYIGARAIED